MSASASYRLDRNRIIGPIDFSAVMEALESWVEMTTGLKVDQLEEPRSFVDPESMATAYMSILGIERIGVDETRMEPGTVFPARQFGVRIMTVQLRVESMIQRLNESAQFYLEIARTGLRRMQIKERLHASGIAIVDTSPTVNLDADMDDRVRSIATFDTRFQLAAHVSDAPVAAVDSVRIRSNTLDDPAGRPVNPQVEITVP